MGGRPTARGAGRGDGAAPAWQTRLPVPPPGRGGGAVGAAGWLPVSGAAVSGAPVSGAAGSGPPAFGSAASGPAAGGVPVSGTSADLACGSLAARAVPAAGRAGAAGAASAAMAVRRRRARAAMMPPTSVGSASPPEEFGRVTAAMTPTSTNTPSPVIPQASRRAASTPMAAAKMARMTRIPVTRASLSCEPNAVMAKSLIAGGVKSIDSWPTATTGELVDPVSPAASWAMPRATPPARTPAIAARKILAAEDLSRVTGVIRSRRPSGLPDRTRGLGKARPKASQGGPLLRICKCECVANRIRASG